MEKEALRVVIDTNEFVFALIGPADNASYRLLNLLVSDHEGFEVRIPQTIATESLRNLPARAHPRFFSLFKWNEVIGINGSESVQVGERYRALGMKTGDALIAAYCDWIETDVLASE